MAALNNREDLESENNSDDSSASLVDDNTDEEESGYGLSAEEDTVEKVVEKKAHVKNLKATQKIKPPTLDEINELKETKNLFHSNLFRLQVKEMLTELQVKEKYTNYLNKWMSELQSFLSNLQSQEECEDVDALSWLKGCPLKYPLEITQAQLRRSAQQQQKKPLKFQFIKPKTEATLIGAALIGALTGSKLVADVCIQIPAEYMQKDNYLNLAYDKKRALYLMYLGAEMLRSQRHFNGLTKEHLHYSYYANNPLKPVLEVHDPPMENTAGMGISAGKLRIRIFLAVDEEAFKLSRFVPWNSNIRASLLHDTYNSSNDVVPLATPNYNGSVLFDLTMKRNCEALQQIVGIHKNYQDGLKLLKVWLQQRQLNIGYSGFNAHLLAMFILYLHKQRKLQPTMSSYQVVRTVWNQLVHSAWDEDGKGISLCDKHVDGQPTLEQFHTHYAVVFVDVTGYYNICTQLSAQIYKRIRQECKWAVELLNDTQLNSFQSLFMIKYPLYTQFDHLLKINNEEAIEQLLDLHVAEADRYDNVGHAYPQLLKCLTTLLAKGLAERIDYLLPIQQAVPSWSVSAKAPKCGNYLHLGILLNPEHACEVINKGPESIAEEAKEFRRFWGDKAQLRRFQDGTITESVVWGRAKDALMQKRLIVRAIVLHLLQNHLQLIATDVEYLAGELDVVCRLTTAFKTDQLREKHPDIAVDADAEHLALRVIRCFDDLARKLRDLKDLPLDIISIAGISPIFRYCEVEPALPQARFIGSKLFATHVYRAVIQLSASGKWPSEVDALRALKTAFYLQIAKLLLEHYRLRSQVTYDGLLVLKQGYCFGLELAHPKEVALLRRESSASADDDVSNGKTKIVKYIDCEESIALERRHYILPRMNGTLHALYQEHPSFGPTVAIAKRWLAAQLIDGGLWPDVCTELLIASQFLKQHTQQPTCSPQTAFMRFLQLLAYTDWQTELIFINFQNSMDAKELADLEYKVNTQRDSFPPLCLATAYDQKHYGKLWTSTDTPSVHVLARISRLAREALDILQAIFMSTAPQTAKPLRIFQASSVGYDLVIQLKPDVISNTLALELGSPFAALGKPNWRLPIADTNFLLEAIQRLREAYGDYAAFFCNSYGGKEIAVLWKPHIDDEKDFKVTDVNGCALSANGKRLQCAKSTLIEDFKFILMDAYLRIDTPEVVLQASNSSKQLQVKNNLNSVKPPVKQKRYFDAKTPNSTDDLVVKKAKLQPKVKSKVQKKVGSKLSITNSKTALTKRKAH